MRPGHPPGLFCEQMKTDAKDASDMTKSMTGAKMVVQALVDQGVEVVFGYPGGAVLPIYDEIFQQNHIKHVRFKRPTPLASPGPAQSITGW